jgi:4-amino-4-deoxy-L-arabinose transferase-like glycosyltransferase
MSLFFGGLVFIALAEVKDIAFCWSIAGMLIGAAMATRTNGITLIGFLLFAITCKGIKISRIKALMLFIIGILVPIVLWCSFAIYSGSSIFPKYTYRNLALTYFSEGSDRTSGDSMRGASEGLTSTWQVLTKDPVHITKTYVRDLIANIKAIFFKEHLLLFPYILLALPGLFVLIFREFNKFNRVLAFNLLAMFFLLNFKAYQNRFFLYLVPFMGAGIASLLTILYSEAKRKGQNVIILLLTLFLLFSSVLSIRQIKHTLAYDTDLSFDSVKASKILKNEKVSKYSTVIARKPHLSFYAMLNWEMFPNEETLGDLKSAVREIVGPQPNDRKVYLLYGFAERKYRPKLAILGSSNLNVPWLHPIGCGEENRGWVLYEILPERF